MGDKKEEEVGKNEIEQVKDETIEEDAQDINVPITSPTHGEKESQQDSVTIEDMPDNSTQNVNPLSEEDLKMLQQESTDDVILCTNPILVRIYESQKDKIASTKVQYQDTSIVPPYVL